MLRQIKKAMLQSPIVLAAPLRTGFEKRPFTQTILSPQGYSMGRVQKIALGLLIVPTTLTFSLGLFSQQWTLFFITGFMIALIALILWILKLRSQMVWKATWHHNSVEVEDSRYGKTDHWTEPLSAFTGLKRDSGLIRRGGQSTPNRQVFGLLLVHPDPFKSVLLHADFDPLSAADIAFYERQLGKRLIGE